MTGAFVPLAPRARPALLAALDCVLRSIPGPAATAPVQAVAAARVLIVDNDALGDAMTLLELRAIVAAEAAYDPFEQHPVQEVAPLVAALHAVSAVLADADPSTTCPALLVATVDPLLLAAFSGAGGHAINPAVSSLPPDATVADARVVCVVAATMAAHMLGLRRMGTEV